MSTHYLATSDPQLGFAPLSQSDAAQVVIVGGGFAGLGTAMSLTERGVRDVMVLEAETVGHGASGRNGGFVFGGFSLDNAQLLRQVGREEGRRLYGLTLQAVQTIRRRIDEHRIDCDAVHSGVLLAHWFVDDAPLKALQRFMRDELGVDWRWIPREQTREWLRSERYHAALHEPDAFHFHPLKYAQGLARALAAAQVRVHEHSRVQAMHPQGGGWRLEVNGRIVTARHVVVACGGYIGRLFPPLSRAIMPIATYVMTTEPLGERLRHALRTDAAVYDTRFAFDYYRPLPDTRLLWGGRISIVDRSPAQVQRLLTRDLLKVYPQLQGVKVEHAWSGLMSYARHKMPQIGRLPDGGPWYAMGFGGHGVAPTTVAGEVLARAITGEAEVPVGFAHYGLPSTHGAFGRAAAQLSYLAWQWRDAARERFSRRRVPGSPA